MAAVMARHRYEYAVICEHFHYTPSQISQLTPRQRAELLFHARDEKHQLVVPRDAADAPTEAGLRMLLDVLSGRAGPPELPQELRRKWGANGGA
jgi:hypothetical protein